MKRLLRLFKHHSTSDGFTLTELLTAISITGIMLAIAGYGMVALSNADQRSQVEISRRANLNRALDFMADEIRMARQIAAPASTSIPRPSCGSAQGVLDLTMPDNTRVIYYIHNIEGCDASLWSKPTTIRRISGTTDTLLVDGLITPTGLPTCSTGTLSGADGFYACLSNTNTKVAQLYLYGRLNNENATTVDTLPLTTQVTARSF